MEVLHGGKEEARIEGRGIKEEGFVADGDDEEGGGGVKREEEELNKWESERGENDVDHSISVFVVGCELCVEFDFSCISDSLRFEFTNNSLEVGNRKSPSLIH